MDNLMNSVQVVRDFSQELADYYFQSKNSKLEPVRQLFEMNEKFSCVCSDEHCLSVSWSEQEEYRFMLMHESGEKGRRKFFEDYRRKIELEPLLSSRVSPQYRFSFVKALPGNMVRAAGKMHYVFLEPVVLPLGPASYDDEFFGKLADASVAKNTVRTGEHEYVAYGILPKSPWGDVSELF